MDEFDHILSTHDEALEAVFAANQALAPLATNGCARGWWVFARHSRGEGGEFR